MGYKLKHIHLFKRVCKDLWKYSKEHRKAGGGLVIRDAAGAERPLGDCGLCFAVRQHHTETRERLAHSLLYMLTYDLYSAYNGGSEYLPGELGVWTPERVALLKFYCETPAGELLQRLVGSGYNREVYGE